MMPFRTRSALLGLLMLGAAGRHQLRAQEIPAAGRGSETVRQHLAAEARARAAARTAQVRRAAARAGTTQVATTQVGTASLRVPRLRPSADPSATRRLPSVADTGSALTPAVAQRGAGATLTPDTTRRDTTRRDTTRVPSPARDPEPPTAGRQRDTLPERDSAFVAHPTVPVVAAPVWPSAERVAARRPTVVVDLEARELSVVSRGDTVWRALVGVGSGRTLVHGRTTWTFVTPRGVRTVQSKVRHPVWHPPLWSYAEVARNKGLTLRQLPAHGIVHLGGGRDLAVREGEVMYREPGGAWEGLVLDEHIVFGNTLFVPPEGTLNREIPGILGDYALRLGDGYMIHGSPDEPDSPGQAVTHGCLRLAPDELAWLYRAIPVGTRVVIR